MKVSALAGTLGCGCWTPPDATVVAGAFPRAHQVGDGACGRCSRGAFKAGVPVTEPPTSREEGLAEREEVTDGRGPGTHGRDGVRRWSGLGRGSIPALGRSALCLVPAVSLLPPVPGSDPCPRGSHGLQGKALAEGRAGLTAETVTAHHPGLPAAICPLGTAPTPGPRPEQDAGGPGRHGGACSSRPSLWGHTRFSRLPPLLAASAGPGHVRQDVVYGHQWTSHFYPEQGAWNPPSLSPGSP